MEKQLDNFIWHQFQIGVNAASVISSNDSITVTEHNGQNEKTLLGIYLNTVAKNLTMTLAQKTIAILLVAFMAFPAAVFCQKHDNNWIIGYDLESNASLSETMLVSFNSSPPSIINWPVVLDFNITTLTVSDSTGNLIFYTNGIHIHDKNDNPMPGGDSLNAGEIAFANWDFGYPAHQAIQALTFPGSNIYYLAHQRFFWLDTFPFHQGSDLLLTTIDMDLNGGSGAVVQKNQLIRKGYSYEFPSATRHANGRDWWVASPELYQNEFFTYMATPYGITDTFTQVIGYKPPALDLIGASQNLFSPDGTTYVDLDHLNGVRIYDFDRCTGMFSNFRQIPSNIVYKTYGGAISPNSQYLYVTANDGQLVLQFDLNANDIAASLDTVAVYDGYMQGPFESRFFWMRLAIDGKIYIATNTRHFHLINSPDTKGFGCDVRQHYIPLPQEPSTIPVYPNYRLGPIDGSPCDTLGIDVATGEEMPSQQKTTYSVSPNPAGEMLTLHTQTTLPANASWELYYSLGNRAMIQPLAQGVHSQSVPLDGLPTGAYFYLIRADGRTLQSGKLIIQR